MGLQSAEQLVKELAANRVGTDVRPTEDQQELNIPRFIVYLFGIVIAEEEYQRWKEHRELLRVPNDERQEIPHSFSFTFSPTRRESRFAAFQKQYWASVNDGDSVLYNRCSNEQKSWISASLASKPYKLTTRVYPSKEQKAIIKRDFLNECKKLESLSNAALESLLREEESSPSLGDGASKQNKRRGKKKKKKQNNRPQQQQFANNIAEHTLVLERGKEDERKVNGTLEEVVATTLQHSSVDSMPGEQTAWVEIGRNDGKQVARNENSPLRQCIPEGKDTPNNTSQDTIPAVFQSKPGNTAEKCVTKNNKDTANASASTSTSDPEDIIVISHENKDLSLAGAGLCSDQIDTIIDNASSSLSPSSSPLSPLIVPRSNSLVTSNTSSDQDGLRDRHYHHVATTTTTATNDFELAKQTQRIADLEFELSDANRQLAKERLLLVQQQHNYANANNNNNNNNNATTKTKPWREEKEQYENLIRALQLRLYISENKLRTYEEALKSHVQAVSTVSSGSNATGMRTDNNNNNEERMLLPNSPSLISKVLRNKKGNGKTGGCIW